MSSESIEITVRGLSTVPNLFGSMYSLCRRTLVANIPTNWYLFVFLTEFSSAQCSFAETSIWSEFSVSVRIFEFDASSILSQIQKRGDWWNSNDMKGDTFRSA